MKASSLAGLLLSAAFFAATQIVMPVQAQDVPISREAYEQAIEKAYPDPRAYLSDAYGKPAAVEDIMAVYSVIHLIDDYALTQGVIDDLAVFAGHPDEKTRITALQSIARMAGRFDEALWSHAFSKLQTFDTDRQASAVRAAAIEQIGLMGGPIGPDHSQDTAPYLFSRLKQDAAPEVRAAAIRALGYTGGLEFNAEKARVYRQYNTPSEADIVRAAVIRGWGILGGDGRQYTEESMKASIDALDVRNPGAVIAEAAKSTVGLFHMNHNNKNYAGSDEYWRAQITPPLMAVLRSDHDDNTRMTALWMWASIAFNFEYGDAVRDLNTAAAVHLSDAKNQKEYDQEVAAVREKLQPALPAPQLQ